MAMTLITTNTSSGDASSSFTSSIDSTYKLYVFKWFEVNPVTDEAFFTFNGSVDGGSNYTVTKTTTYFEARADEGTTTSFEYKTDNDVAQGTGYQNLCRSVGNDNDQSTAGTLWLFNPSNTTYVKHFYAQTSTYASSSPYDYAIHGFIGGYFNTTDNIDAIDFKFDSGNIDVGTIKMYGVG